MQHFDRIQEEFVITAWRDMHVVRTWTRDRLAAACGIARSALEHTEIDASYAEVRGCQGAGEILYAVKAANGRLNVVKTVSATRHL